MDIRIKSAVTLVIALILAVSGHAQSTPDALDVVPENMPFNTPYGSPISLARAQAVAHAATEEAVKHGWQMNIAIVDSGANLVSFQRMDGALLASIALAEHKARVSVRYRRPTRAFEDASKVRVYLHPDPR